MLASFSHMLRTFVDGSVASHPREVIQPGTVGAVAEACAGARGSREVVSLWPFGPVGIVDSLSIVR